MFGLIKNNIKTKIGIVLPASYPASRVTHESVSVTADGVKTYAALFNELFALIDGSKINASSVMRMTLPDTYTLVYQIASYYGDGSNGLTFRYIKGKTDGTTGFQILTAVLDLGTSLYINYDSGTQTNISSSVPSNGRVFEVRY